MNLEQLIKAGEPFAFELDPDMLHQLQGCGDRLATTLRAALLAYLETYQPTSASYAAVEGRLESLDPEKCWWALPHDLASRLAALGGESSDHVRAACKAFLSAPPVAPDVDMDAPDGGDGW